jgi:hypothetical protein
VLVLGWSLAALCIGVCVIVGILLMTALFHRRGATGHGMTERGGGRAVLAGTVISTMLLLAALIGMLWVLAVVASPLRDPALTITVIAPVSDRDVHQLRSAIHQLGGLAAHAGVHVFEITWSAWADG